MPCQMPITFVGHDDQSKKDGNAECMGIHHACQTDRPSPTTVERLQKSGEDDPGQAEADDGLDELGG